MNQTVELLHSKGIILNRDGGEVKKVLIGDVEIFYLKFSFYPFSAKKQ